MKKIFTLLVSTVALAALFSFERIVDWIEYASESGNYKILMPARPQEQSQKIPSALGELTMFIALVEADESDDNLLYMSAFSIYPAEKINSDMSKEDLDRFFNGAADGAAKNMNGKVKTITETKYKEFPARQIVTEGSMEGESFLALQKLILVKNKFYLLQTLTKAGKGENGNAKKFFGSFHLN